jgi:hypothetical protein
MKTIKYIEVKRSAFLKDKKVLLDGKNILTRIIDLKGGNWNECVRDTDSDGKTTISPVYPTYYKIDGYYYV